MLGFKNLAKAKKKAVKKTKKIIRKKLRKNFSNPQVLKVALDDLRIIIKIVDTKLTLAYSKKSGKIEYDFYSANFSKISHKDVYEAALLAIKSEKLNISDEYAMKKEYGQDYSLIVATAA